jgi:dienelactone hydrolase
LTTAFEGGFVRASVLAVIAWLALGTAMPAHAVRGAERVEFDSLDLKDGRPLRLFGWFLPAPPSDTPAPIVIALHGCGGLYGRDNDLNRRHRAMAELLHAHGYHVLFPDSFTPRGQRSICAERIGTRDIRNANRRRDVLAALDWAAARENVDASRLALLGWSHGGGTVLSANNLGTTDVAAHKTKPRAVIAFYPGCAAYANAREVYRPRAPVLLLIGEKDDWTPPQPCVTLQEKVRSHYPGDTFEVRLYPDSYHNFDAPEAPLRRRKDIPNGVRPGDGVTTGSNPAAREQAYREVLEFLRAQMARPGSSR